MSEQKGMCPMGKQCPLSQDRFERMAEQVGQIYTVLFGVEGKGGLDDRVASLETKEVSRAKASGWIVGFTGIMTFVGTKLWDTLTK